jgi:hypothetical protein
MVHSLISRSNVSSNKTTRSQQVNRQPNEWTFRELSQKTNTSEPTLYSWMLKGILKARRDTYTSQGGVWLITADEIEIARLRAIKNQPKQWIYHSRVAKIH